MFTGWVGCMAPECQSHATTDAAASPFPVGRTHTPLCLLRLWMGSAWSDTVLDAELPLCCPCELPPSQPHRGGGVRGGWRESRACCIAVTPWVQSLLQQPASMTKGGRLARVPNPGWRDSGTPDSPTLAPSHTAGPRPAGPECGQRRSCSSHERGGYTEHAQRLLSDTAVQGCM